VLLACVTQLPAPDGGQQDNSQHVRQRPCSGALVAIQSEAPELKIAEYPSATPFPPARLEQELHWRGGKDRPVYAKEKKLAKDGGDSIRDHVRAAGHDQIQEFDDLARRDGACIAPLPMGQHLAVENADDVLWIFALGAHKESDEFSD
jgi:hypothetical protein